MFKNKNIDYLISLLSILGVAMILTFGSAQGSEVPKLTEYVNDYANVLSKSELQNLNSRLSDVNKKGIGHPQIVVLILPSLSGNDLDSFANDVFHKNGIGQKDNNNGVLTLLAMKEHRSRMEVGYDLEPVITDSVSKSILDKMIPALKSGNVNQALNDEMDALIPLVVKGSGETKELHPTSSVAHSSITGTFIMGTLFLLLILGAILYFCYKAFSSSRKVADDSNLKDDRSTYTPTPSTFSSNDSYSPPRYTPPSYTPPAPPSSNDSTLKSAAVGGLAGAAASELFSSRRRNDNDSSYSPSSYTSSSSDSSSSSSSSSSDSGSSWSSDSGFSGGGGDSGGGGSDSSW